MWWRLPLASTIWNVFSVSFLAMGNAVGILIGQKLGAGEPEEEVRSADRKLIAFSVMFCLGFGIGTGGAFSGVPSDL